MTANIYGYMPNGTPVYQYTLANSSAMSVSVIAYGATITAINVPDINGNIENVVLSYDNLQEYLKGTSYLGALVGRVANRIGNARFYLENQNYQLDCNEGRHHLHGGFEGFDKKIWSARIVSGADYSELVLSLTSDSGDQGYPGKLDVEVTYRLTNANELKVMYRAVCQEASTPINLTQHSYFNLSGTSDEPVYKHKLHVNSALYTPTDTDNIATGAIAPVAGSLLDFQHPCDLESVLTHKNAEPLALDHNFLAAEDTSLPLNFMAKLYHDKSRRYVKVYSTQPCIQVYAGNYLHTDGAQDSLPFKKHAGICLECQGFPNAVNHRHFPSTIINPEEVYSETTIYQFGVLPAPC